jgi:hypothetical protein
MSDFWIKKNIIVRGIIKTEPAAAMLFHSIPVSVTKEEMATGSVFVFMLERIRAKINSLQDRTNT